MELLKHPPRIDLDKDIVRISPRGIPVIELNPQPKQEKTVVFSRPPRIHLNKDIVFTMPGRPPRIVLNSR